MGLYIELPEEWAKWSFDVRDIHDNILEAKVTDLDLVRCGECKHWHDDGIMTTCDKHIGHGFPSDYFCADGERRADEHTDKRD